VKSADANLIYNPDSARDTALLLLDYISLLQVTNKLSNTGPAVHRHLLHNSYHVAEGTV